ncbi:MAG: hypothetical protein VW405_09400 [Rhodospirillaceae bacterium]
MPGPSRKPDDERQRTNSPSLELVTPLDVELAVPDPGPDWSEATVAEWRAWWGSEVARLIEPESETPIVRRLFDLLDQAARFEAAGRLEPMVEGSTGQLVINPLLKHAQGLRDEARRDESVLGRGPKRRLDLGIKFGDAARSLDEINRRLNGGSNSGPSPVPQDPRQAIEGRAREA